jgi:hypothetical protein
VSINLFVSQLNRQAAALVARIAFRSAVSLDPTRGDQVADTLVGVQLWREQTPLVYAERIDAAGVAGALAEQIARLNRAGKMSFKEAMSLRVGGLDRYSRWHLQDLVVAVGAAGVAVVEAAFPGEAEEAIKAREVALRWMVRGLAAQLAIRKVQVDQELLAKATKALLREPLLSGIVHGQLLNTPRIPGVSGPSR